MSCIENSHISFIVPVAKQFLDRDQDRADIWVGWKLSRTTHPLRQISEPEDEWIPGSDLQVV